MRPGLSQEENGGYYRKASSGQVGVIEAAQFLRDAAPGHQPDTDAYIPTGQIGRGSRAPLVVGSQVYE